MTKNPFSICVATSLLFSCAHNNPRPHQREVANSLVWNRSILDRRRSELPNQQIAAKSLDTTLSAISKELEKFNLSGNRKNQLAEIYAKYMDFLGITPQQPSFKRIFSRILGSSPQFLLCEDVNDWSCLERDSEIVSNLNYRRPVKENLGEPISVAEKLQVDHFFTYGWLKQLGIDPQEAAANMGVSKYKILSETLGDLISADWNKISIAIYGIDDITGKMKPVYSALTAKPISKLSGVFDTNGFSPTLYEKDKTPKKEFFPVIFSYSPPNKEDLSFKRWMFSNSPLKEVSSNSQFQPKLRTNVDLQYTGSAELINYLNQDIKNDNDARARLEWPNEKTEIMHNKFFVFERGENTQLPEMAVWTGTANVARTCMGEEQDANKKSNANMGLFIKNKAIAQVFLDEFNEMFAWSDTHFATDGGQLVNGKGENFIPIGTFHKSKRPNTNRYFKFADGNEVRVHFSPTDDAEHRVIIPMLLSAKKGDVIRVSMFGGGGLEFVRAFQWAQAQGADVKIVFDALTGGCGMSTWVTSEDEGLISRNPFLAEIPTNEAGNLEVKISSWTGMNHMKVATLTRGEKTGVAKTEVIIIGSQNWTRPGNDENDENEISIRNVKVDVPMAVDFNKYFDTYLYPFSISWERFKSETAPTKCKGQGGH